MKFENTTEMLEFTRRTMKSLSMSPVIDGPSNMINLVRDRSGLSLSMVEKFYYGHIKDIRLTTMDALLTAVKKVQKELANS